MKVYFISLTVKAAFVVGPLKVRLSCVTFEKSEFILSFIKLK